MGGQSLTQSLSLSESIWHKQKFLPHLAWMSIFEVLCLQCLRTPPHIHSFLSGREDTLLPVLRRHRNSQLHFIKHLLQVRTFTCNTEESVVTHNHSHTDCPATKEKKKKILLYWIHFLTTKIADTNIQCLLSYDSLLRMGHATP